MKIFVLAALLMPTLAFAAEAELTAVCFISNINAGCTSPFSVRVEKNSGDKVAIGAVEEFYGGSGETWRASTWIAAFNASLALGLPLQDHRFVLQTRGHIDGPSAGLLMTAGMMALMRGDKIRKDTTMTGAVNPDGSAGPVGGIPQKMAGAKRAGLKRFGFPTGMRMSVDLETKKRVDLFARAKKLGLKAREIDDIYEAHTFLTGKTIKRAPPIDESEIALSPEELEELTKVVTALTQDAIKKFKGQSERVKRQSQAVRAATMPSLQQFATFVQRAQRFEQEGNLVAAYFECIYMHIMLSSIEVGLDSVDEVKQLKIDKLLAKTKEIDQAVAIWSKVFQTIASAYDNVSPEEAVAGMAALSSLVTARSLLATSHNKVMTVEAALKTGKADLEAVVVEVNTALIYTAAARATIAIAARRATVFGSTPKSKLRVDRKKLETLAQTYGSVASANIAYVDAFLLNGASIAHLSQSQKRGIAMNARLDYLLASRSASIAEWEPTTTPLARLSAGLDAYLRANEIVLKIYSLGFDERTNTARNKRALQVQLEFARQSVLSAFSKTKARFGSVPLAARMEYEYGRALMTGNDKDRVDALSSFWRASSYVNLMALLTE